MPRSNRLRLSMAVSAAVSAVALTAAAPVWAQTPANAQASAQAAPPAARPAPPPCLGDPLFEQFNFLLGKWDVFRGETRTAEVIWTREYGGCAFVEVWNAAIPGRQSGLGLVTYSRLRGTPTYYYVGDQGGNTVSVRAETGPDDVIFIIEQPSTQGEGTRTRRFQLVLQPDGSILEHSTASENGGPYELEFQLVWRKSE